MKSEDLKALGAIAASKNIFLELSTDSKGESNLKYSQKGWLGRLIMWLCHRLGKCGQNKFDNVVKYTVGQMKKASQQELPPPEALKTLLSKITRYNLRHGNLLNVEFNYINQRLNFILASPPPQKTISPPQPKQTQVHAETMAPQQLSPAKPQTPPNTTTSALTNTTTDTPESDHYVGLPEQYQKIGLEIEGTTCEESYKVRARFMAQDLGLIEIHLPQLKALKTDVERSKEINRLATSSYGRSAGEEETQSYQSLVARNELFLTTFSKAKAKGKLNEFIVAFTKLAGGPCLTGRTEAMQAFASELAGNSTATLPADVKDLLVLPCNQWTERLLNLFEQGRVSITSVNSDFLKQHLLDNLDGVVKEFEGFEEKELGVKFLTFLEQEGIYKKGSPVVWADLIPAAIKSPKVFEIMYNYTILFTKETQNNLEF